MSSKGAPARPSRSQALDDLIMGTNSSSIVSKRSVERLYHPDEPHYFRYFVKKPQRRAPLINRGYWLRLKAIDVVVRQFLSRPSANKKVVINLGCGSDVLPWQCHARYGDVCTNALFVDVDYPDLMLKKRKIVLETPQLRELLGPDVSFSETDKDAVLIKSPTYCQVACDLRELETLRRTLASLVPLSDSEVLFVAEVSVTYMDTLSADSVIEWASSIGKAEFCLLEQILPQGPDHPFAQTMLKHFEKLNTPLKSVLQYPTLESQKARFRSRGWGHIDIWDLWEAWSGDDFLTSAERAALDDIEPFDEWEELMLFGRHYFVMHARANDSPNEPKPVEDEGHVEDIDLKVVPISHSKPIKRRFGNVTVIPTAEGERFGAHILGLGSDGRSDTYDLYALDDAASTRKLPIRGPPTRMCSTLTDLGECGTLLAGGRASPGKAFADCWILKKGPNSSWQRTWDLPIALYRHSTVRLKGSWLALVMGGRTGASGVSHDSFVFHPEKGWAKCKTSGVPPEAVFGAVACNSSETSTAKGFEGIICGGIREDGTLSSKKYMWRLDMGEDEPSLFFEEFEVKGPRKDILSIFGAEAIDLGTCTAICGGTGGHEVQQGQSIIFITISQGRCNVLGLAYPHSRSQEWPFMIGSAVIKKGSNLTVLGGGATCFSMGTYWETSSYEIEVSNLVGTKHQPQCRLLCQYLESPKIVAKTRDDDTTIEPQGKASITKVPRITLGSREQFEECLRGGKPVVFGDLNIGPCRESWTPQYMVDQVGREKEVVVHECKGDNEKMDFGSKNFQYITDTFANIVGRIQKGGRLYLRSLSHSKPSESPANMDEDFPGISQDFQLPEELEFVRRNLFSSVLRLSGRVNMWLHYDVMANVYVQIRGSKRMVLFPPSDVSHLSFAPGASSSSLDVFASLDSPSLLGTRPHEVILEPGDVLFLPPMWLHTATPTTDMSVAVNVFFRDLDGAYSSGRDVYGNRDLAAYEKGRQDAFKIEKNFEKLPREIRSFYLSRIADELKAAAERS